MECSSLWKLKRWQTGVKATASSAYRRDQQRPFGTDEVSPGLSIAAVPNQTHVKCTVLSGYAILHLFAEILMSRHTVNHITVINGFSLNASTISDDSQVSFLRCICFSLLYEGQVHACRYLLYDLMHDRHQIV